MHFKNPYWSPKTQIELLQKWILVHSIIYYELNTTLVSDQVYDNNGKQLLQLMKTHPEVTKVTRWAYAFKGYDANTGYDLYSKLYSSDKIELYNIAQRLINGKN
jgi:hypothetical protein